MTNNTNLEKSKQLTFSNGESNKHNKPTMPLYLNLEKKKETRKSPFHQLIAAGQTGTNRCRMQSRAVEWAVQPAH